MRFTRIAVRIKSLLVTIALSCIVLSTLLTSSYADKDKKGASQIQYLVVIFQENVSFDHYFATYPNAANSDNGEPRFHPDPNTPSVNGLTDPLLGPNNSNSVQPFLLKRSQAVTCDQDHDYTPEQQAFDAGLMDKFVEFTNDEKCSGPLNPFHTTGLVMG
jgi:phospholipase C